MAEQVVGKLFVDHHDLGREVRGHARQSKAILGGLNLEVGIGENGGHRAQRHRSNECRHRRNALRHDDDDAVAGGNSMVAEQCGLYPGSSAKLSKCHFFVFVLVDPRRDERTLAGRGVEGVDQSAELVHVALILVDSTRAAPRRDSGGGPRCRLRASQSNSLTLSQSMRNWMVAIHNSGGECWFGASYTF